VLGRFLHMGVDTYSFVAALNGILAQRLLRIVCAQCAEATVPSHQLLDEAGIGAGALGEYAFRSGSGCRHCRGTGYRGRVAVGELLMLNDELREAIIERAPVRRLKELARAGGSRFLRHSALDLVKQGRTTLEEVNRVTAMA